MVFYCERAVGFCSDIGNDDDAYFGALVRMFEQALGVANTLPASGRDGLIARLDMARRVKPSKRPGQSEKLTSGVLRPRPRSRVQ